MTLVGLSQALFRERRISAKAKLTIISAVVSATALWGAEVWLATRQGTASMQKIYDRGIRQCLGIPPSLSSADACRMESRQRALYTLGRRRQARALFKWAAATPATS